MVAQEIAAVLSGAKLEDALPPPLLTRSCVKLATTNVKHTEEPGHRRVPPSCLKFRSLPFDEPDFLNAG
jgi:hypothetical protein